MPQATWARQLNTVGRYLDLESVVPIEVPTLLAAAQRRAGLEDFGDEGFLEGLSVLVDSLNQDAQLTLLGRLIARAELERILFSRLRIVAIERHHPEIQDETITEPLFIVGMGRTGSSILYECIMQDPAHRAPQGWEKKLPAILEDKSEGKGRGKAQHAAEQFIEWIGAETGLMYQVDSSLVSKHEANAFLPEECSQLFAHEFRSGHFFSRNNVPAYAAWNAQAGAGPALEMHKRILRILQWQQGAKPRPRWILKYGGHLGHMPELFATYPDAKVIHTHRDPAVVVRSLISLVASLRLMRSDSFDPHSSVELLNGGMARGLEKCMDERGDNRVPQAQFADIHFRDLMEDPISAICGAYGQLDMPFTKEAEQAMASYLEQRPRSKHGKHEYAYADAVDMDREKQRFARYVQHYGIAQES